MFLILIFLVTMVLKAENTENENKYEIGDYFSVGVQNIDIYLNNIFFEFKKSFFKVNAFYGFIGAKNSFTGISGLIYFYEENMFAWGLNMSYISFNGNHITALIDMEFHKKNYYAGLGLGLIIVNFDKSCNNEEETCDYDKPFPLPAISFKIGYKF